MQVNISTRIPYELAMKLEAYHKATEISKAAIVAAALAEYLKDKA
jgi:predicted DNA-binding protein